MVSVPVPVPVPVVPEPVGVSPSTRVAAASALPAAGAEPNGNPGDCSKLSSASGSGLARFEVLAISLTRKIDSKTKV